MDAMVFQISRQALFGLATEGDITIRTFNDKIGRGNKGAIKRSTIGASEKAGEGGLSLGRWRRGIVRGVFAHATHEQSQNVATRVAQETLHGNERMTERENTGQIISRLIFHVRLSSAAADSPGGRDGDFNCCHSGSENRDETVRGDGKFDPPL